LERASNGSGEFVGFVAASPDWSDSMDNEPGREISPGCVRRLVMGDGTVCLDPGTALVINTFPSPAGNDSRDPTTVLEPIICRIDDGIHFFLGNIALHNFEGLTRGEDIAYGKFHKIIIQPERWLKKKEQMVFCSF
jgi:hypothetical protein